MAKPFKTKSNCKKCGGRLYKKPSENLFQCDVCSTKFRLPENKVQGLINQARREILDKYCKRAADSLRGGFVMDGKQWGPFR